MATPANLNPRIIEALYGEGLALSDEVRAAFSFGDREPGDPEEAGRVALSCEALRTTTRMMHAVAWLLNHRAYFRGEVSEFQLRRHGRLKCDFPAGDPARLTLLSPEVRALIEATERFYERLVRLDSGWRNADPDALPAVQRLRERLGKIARL